MPLLAVPNVSEGRRAEVVERLAAAFGGRKGPLDVHSDHDHNRTVITFAGDAEGLTDALLAGASEAVASIDMRSHEGLHPCVGAIDVCPVVHLGPDDLDAARAVALEAGRRLADELEVPVFLYGSLATSPERRERAHFRRGGYAGLLQRVATGAEKPDFGAAGLHPSAGATLVTARPPLVAFNVELDSPDQVVAHTVAAHLREAGGGLEGVRAIGLPLSSGRTQVSTNVHDPWAVPLATVVAEVLRLAAPHDARPVAAELVGLAPEAAFEGFPEDLPIPGFDPERHLIERILARDEA